MGIEVLVGLIEKTINGWLAKKGVIKELDWGMKENA